MTRDLLSAISRLALAAMLALTLAAAHTSPASAAPTVTSAIIGSNSWGVEALSDGSRVYVSSPAAGTVSVIDTNSASLIATIPVERTPYLLAAAPDDRQVYVANADSGTVSVIDTSTNAVTATIVTAGRPMGVAVSDTTVYVADATRNAVVTIDRTANTVDAVIPVGSTPYDAVLTASGSALYVGNRFGSSVSVIDTATNAVTSTIALHSGAYPFGMDASDSHVYVTDRFAPNVSVIDTATRSIVQTIPIGPTVDVEISRTRDVGYILGDNGGISVFKPSANPTTTTTTNGLSSGSGLAEAGRRVYASSHGGVSVSVVDFTSLSPASQAVTATAGTAIAPTQQLVAEGIDGTPTFTVSPALPDGLELDAASGVISGTPTTAQTATTYTITATDGTTSVTATVSLSVAALVTPARQIVAGSVGTAITPTTAPTVKGLPGTVTYSVSPALPAGLNLGTGTGIVSGTPTAAQGATSYTLQASNGALTTTSSLSISVSALSPATQAVTATHGEAIDPSAELSPSGGFDGAVAYTVSPALPAGLSLDPETGVISGTPTAAAQAATTYTITGTGSVAGTAVATVSISVAPSLTWTDTAVQGTVGTALTPTLPPTVAGFAGEPTFSVSPTLPSGLSIDAATGVISGTPDAAMGSTDYTVTADDGASSASRVVAVQIAGVTPATQSVDGTRGTAMSATSALTATGFTGAVTYSVSPSLPTGLSIDAGTGAMSGTPTGRAQDATDYTVTGTGADAGTATAIISISVAAVAPDPVTGVVAAPGVEEATVSWTAPTDDGGTSPVTFAVTPSTGGTGCITTEMSCVLTGLPAGSTTFTVTASTSGGTSAGVTSSAVTVAAKPAPAPGAPADPTLSASVSIAGARSEGRTLTAQTAMPGRVSYQWLAGGKPIKGATKRTLRLGKAQAARRISVAISSGRLTATSKPTQVISSKRSRLVVSTHSVQRGGDFRVTSTGLKRHQRVRIWLAGQGVYVGRADRRGIVDRTVRFPASVDGGLRRVRVSGYDSDNARTSTIRTSVRYRTKLKSVPGGQ